MGNHIETYTQRTMVKENKNGYILESEPLEKSLKLKKKLSNILAELEIFENNVIEQFHSESEDYTEETYILSQKISSIISDIKIEDLEISLGDFNHKNK